MNEKMNRKRGLGTRSALAFIVVLGIVSLFADMTYEGGRSIVGQYLQLLGSTAAAVGIAAGAGELLGYVVRFVSGVVADKTQRYWAITIFGYVLQLFALPALAFVGRWELAIALVFIERIGKGIRNPSRDALLTYATSQTGRGFGFGLHEALDQIGAVLGPVMLSIVLYVKAHAEATSTELQGYQSAFTVLFIPAAIAILLVVAARFLFPRPSDFEVKSNTPQIATRGFSRVYWYYLAAAALLAAGITDFPLIAYHLKSIELIPEHLIPTMYAVAMAIDAGAALFFGRLYDRKGFGVLIAMFTLEAFTAPFVFLGGIPSVIVGMALWGISMGAQESVMRAVIADIVPTERRATAYGLYYTAFGIAWFAGSALMGFLYDRHVYALVIFSVAVQVSAIPVVVIANRMRHRESSTHTNE